MHGRLKVKTTAEQEAEKQKERSIKLAKYIKGITAVYSKKVKEEHDTEALQFTTHLLLANPDALSLWNFRRTVLLTLQKNNDESYWQEILENERNTTEMCLLKNPKSYGAWHHRDWVLKKIPNPPYEEELQLCNSYIQKDERNFHCWDHRRLIVSRSNRSLAKELAFTQELIEKNFSNYSAWHYRSILLPVIYPPENESPHPIAEEIFLKELRQVVSAVFTDPSDQSPWFFLRWLISKKEDSPRLVQVGVVPVTGSNKSLILVFSNPVITSEDLSVIIDEKEVAANDIHPMANPCIWTIGFVTTHINTQIKVHHKKWICEQSVELENHTEPSFHWISKKLSCQQIMSDKSKETLCKVMKDCITLDQLDPSNKWVLLTLVDIMSSVDVREYQTQILSYLEQLQEVDHLRANYYRDVRSKVLMEGALIDYLENESRSFSLAWKNLTRTVSTQYLSSAESVDLSGNKLLSCITISSLLNCRELTLDGVQLADLQPVSCLKYLQKLSLNGCGICSADQLQPVAANTSLEELSVKDNNISAENFNNTVKSLIPSLRKITIS